MRQGQDENGARRTAEWLAAKTLTDPEQVIAELAAGDHRRAFIVDELADAGYEGSELVGYVVALTGLDTGEAARLIAVRAELVPVPDDGADVPQRDARLAANEVAFRALNERLAATEVGTGTRAFEIMCECSDRDCRRVFTIPTAEYEWLRQNPRRFAVLPGHEAPAVEAVVERHDGFVVIEKHAETHDLVDGLASPP